MIDECTWHRSPVKQKRFVWSATIDGIQLHHTNENGSYLIPWTMFHAILQQAREMAAGDGNIVTAGTNQDNPTPGSVGEWILTQKFCLSTGYLSPRHLSFIGPILGRMGFITHKYNGISIQWVFK